MDLIKCPLCGHDYHPSYRSCPFCEELDDSEQAAPRRTARRHIADKRKAQSARSAIIAVLVLVLALFGWFLFGGKGAPHADAPAKTTETEPAKPAETGKSAEPAKPAETTEPADATAPADAADPAQGEPAEPAEPAGNTQSSAEAAHVNASSLALKTNVSGTLAKEPSTGVFDCSISRSDNIRLIVTGTDVPVSSWKSDNTGVLEVDGNGKLSPQSAGKARVTATVGDAQVSCIVRVR